jgi:hypothetical protein
VSYDYTLMFLPSIRPDSYVLVTSQGDSVAVRHYASREVKPTPDRSRNLAKIKAERRRPGAPDVQEERHSTEDLNYWYRRTAAANRRAGLGGQGDTKVGAGRAEPPSAIEAPPPAPAQSLRFVDHRGKALTVMADWQALHPELHWKAGHSAMELARSWHAAEGFPGAVAHALRAEPFRGLRLDRAIAECRTAVPGAGRPSHTDLMVEATDGAGHRVVVAVEGKVRESFGPLVAAWLQEVDHERSAANKQERLRGLCEGLGLTVAGTDSLRYQLLHRTWAGLRHAAELGATQAVLLVHSFAPTPDADNRSAFAAFLTAMGHTGFKPGALAPLGRRMGIDLWAAWVSDTPLPTQ